MCKICADVCGTRHVCLVLSVMVRHVVDLGVYHRTQSVSHAKRSTTQSVLCAAAMCVWYNTRVGMRSKDMCGTCPMRWRARRRCGTYHVPQPCLNPIDDEPMFPIAGYAHNSGEVPRRRCTTALFYMGALKHLRARLSLRSDLRPTQHVHARYRG